MLAPHAWPRPVKEFVVTGAMVLVILTYVVLCIGGWLGAAVLVSFIRP